MIVYSIGLGIDKLYTVRGNEESQKAALYTLCPNMSSADITATKSYTINGVETTENIASSGDQIDYTITLTNNNNQNATVTVKEYTNSTDDVKISNYRYELLTLDGQIVSSDQLEIKNVTLSFDNFF